MVWGRDFISYPRGKCLGKCILCNFNDIIYVFQMFIEMRISNDCIIWIALKLMNKHDFEYLLIV